MCPIWIKENGKKTGKNFIRSNNSDHSNHNHFNYNGLDTLMDSITAFAIAAAITIIFLLFSLALALIFVFLLLSSRAHYNSGGARKARENIENNTAQRIPGIKEKEARLTVLDGSINNLQIMRNELANEIKAEHKVTDAAMRALKTWTRYE